MSFETKHARQGVAPPTIGKSTSALSPGSTIDRAGAISLSPNHAPPHPLSGRLAGESMVETASSSPSTEPGQLQRNV